MKNKFNIFVILCCTIILLSCKDDFLNEKPKTSLVVPTTLGDFEAMLNSPVIYKTGALGQMACDDYEFTDYASWQSTGTATERNSYIWARDLFAGEQSRPDWNEPYSSIFYANNILKGLAEINPRTDISKYNQIRGWALYVRSAAFYDLLQNFAPPYDPSTASEDLGIPLRLTPGVDEILPRSSVAECYARILTDLIESGDLLTATFPITNRYMPCKAAAFGLLSRIYLNMNLYKEASKFTDLALAEYNKLIDYNSLSQTSGTPFSFTHDELILNSSQVSTYEITIPRNINTRVRVSPDLIKLYDTKDLRLSIFFERMSNGNYSMKRGYYGSTGNYGFSGIATDELFLTKAECQARNGETANALFTLNQLLVKRYATGNFVPTVANSATEALTKILVERRKELVWRNLRWPDLRRLNKSGMGIILKRSLNGAEYILAPNSSLYTFPIPDDEINASGIQQNLR
ncbi:RagB/SusD family nutrient uptake outer membrane protein [Pedobacter jeongneungensis]|uniref:RagB/SusD family nutrient uptake outer membrane protein n=1 Tax=Pedobacter jeongneungensis TaxID=947309 RepID=UPI0004696166|nr:RagB/SusD family nutrient uptake outer membrane protein [Pedobacter jeongneungensis]